MLRQFLRGAAQVHVLHHAAEGAVHGAWLAVELGRHGYRIVSGGRELAGLGATLLVPAAGGLGFPHRGVAGGDEIEMGDMTLGVLATPGHSPEHVS